MKKLFVLVCTILLISGCTNPNSGNLEKRIAELEKSSALKDKQIIGLSYLAYFSAFDSSNNVIASNRVPVKFFMGNALARPSKCMIICNRAYNNQMKRCGKIQSQKDRDKCEAKADLNWEECSISCSNNNQ